MAITYAKDRVRVNAIAPALTLTERLVDRLGGQEVPTYLSDRFPLEVLRPEQIAAASLFLISDASSGMTGQIVGVDAGGSVA